MNNSSPTWATYHALMSCCLVVMGKRRRVNPVGIGETLGQALAKVVMRAAGDQAKTACGNLQLCAGLEASIEGATHAVGHQTLERVQGQQCEEEETYDYEVEEEESRGVVAEMGNLSIDTAGTEEEATNGLAAALWMEIEEDRGSTGGGRG